MINKGPISYFLFFLLVHYFIQVEQCIRKMTGGLVRAKKKIRLKKSGESEFNVREIK
jgi:hypothetical protein